MQCLYNESDCVMIVSSQSYTLTIGKQGESNTRRFIFTLSDGVTDPVSAKVIYISHSKTIEAAAAIVDHAIHWEVTQDFTTTAGMGELDVIVTCADGGVIVPYTMKAVVARSICGSGVS